MAELVRIPDALCADAVEAIRDAINASPLVGRSTLAGSFRASTGFAMTFTAGGIERLGSQLPELAPFLELALKPSSNAWYLNALVLSGGSAVGRHIDGTLRGPSGDENAVPDWVSVLYLVAPSARGGELVLTRQGREVGRVKPVPGLLIHFRGDLEHEVTTLKQPTEAPPRMSVVLEQYHLAPEPLARVPEFKLESRAGFSAYLKHHQRVRARSFDP